jgi:hypothetical protein
MPLPAPVTNTILPFDSIFFILSNITLAPGGYIDLARTLPQSERVSSIDVNLADIIERFIAAAAEPALLDPGEAPLAIVPGQWSVTEWNGRLVLQAWDQHRNLVRKITGLREQRRDRLSLTTERFPRSTAELQIADLAAPAGRELGRRAGRHAFRERFQFMLSRELPGWRIEEVSADANLEQSLSPAYTRAFLRQGSTGIAVMAAPPDTASCGGIVAIGLIWLDYLRRREKALSVGRLLLFVPVGAAREVASRAACLDPERVACQLFAFDDKDRAGLIDFADGGNLESTLPPCRRTAAPNAASVVFDDMDDVDRVEHADGSISLQVRGLEFARASGGKIYCGIARRHRSNAENVLSMGREITRVRRADAEDRLHPLYSLQPEGWLESQVRARPETIDASLRPVPLYGQVPIFHGSERGIIDLLGIDHSGRLVVIELKAAADLQLPFQALDYWLRVRKHLLAGDFERQGYFAGHVVSPQPPRILLVAPALEFHSTIETVLGALDPTIEVTRIGLAADWRRELRVMFRLRGSERPQ